MYIVWCVLCIFAKILAQDPIVNIPQGRIVGIKAYLEDSITPVEIYYGVPYATAPKGRYRFSAPERHAGWRRTLFAHRIPPHCPNVGDQEKDNFSEDCLFLNIWTPRRSDGKLLPVVVILYSESWIKGGIPLPCQELASEGVVVVTAAYRLHLLAFFSLMSISARGNLALLDQYLALLWVRDNIAAFGGDPTAITVLGHSAGADSVLHLMTSPRTVGLFQRAIIMSPFDIWKAIDGQRVIEVAELERISREIAHTLGCDSDMDQNILRCLRERPLSDIMTLYSNKTWITAMQPIPDKFLSASEQFLPNSLMAAFSSAMQPNLQLDVLIGANDLEVLNYDDDRHDEMIKRGPIYISDYLNIKVIPESLRLFSMDQSSTLPSLTAAIRWEYWHEKPTKEANILKAIDSLGRIESSAKWGTGIALLAARLARRVARLYVYRYSQPSGVDLRGLQYNFTGAVHGSDLVSLLGDSMMLQVARRPPTANEKRVSSLLRKHVVNFIKFGSPAEENQWLRYRIDDAHIYDIHDKESAFEHYSVDRDVKFWLQYLPELYNLLQSAEKTEKLTGVKGDGRLRGGVFAMSGVAVVLLLLLGVCADRKSVV